LRRIAREAEDAIARLTQERAALDRALAQPHSAASNRLGLSDALKRRAELVRLIERAEREWLAAEESIEREAERDRGGGMASHGER
jgi:ATP-binding cassette subfamily F protein 3